MRLRRLLWIGDAGCPSGFARATHAILEQVRKQFEVTVLGLNYRGDPHEYPYKMYAAAPGGDLFGVGRLLWMCDVVKPDVIVIQNDGWNIPNYIKQLQRAKEYASIPVIAIVAVDGKNFRNEWLTGVAHTIFWTEFAAQEAREGGYYGPTSVIPLGVDLDIYYPTDPVEARKSRFGEHFREQDVFIVGTVNRNQPRKRWDLTIRYFAKWVREYSVPNAYLFLHTAPTGDAGVDVAQLSKYYGIDDRILLFSPPIWYGVPEAMMRDTYNCFDLQISTTQGEGFGLTTFEGMACGVPQIVPDWSALGEFCVDAAMLVPCTSTSITMPYVNVIGGVPDEALFVQALDEMYQKKELRELYSRKGLIRVSEDRFNWKTVGTRFTEEIVGALTMLEAAEVV